MANARVSLDRLDHDLNPGRYATQRRPLPLAFLAALNSWAQPYAATSTG